MADKYGIFVQGKIDTVHTWRFLTITEATTEAEQIALKHNVPVIVFEIIGQIAPAVKWTPQEEMK